MSAKPAYSTPGARLREERQAHNVTQADMAAWVETAKRTVIDWELGRTYPNVRQLAVLAARDFDVLYIITGIRAGAADDFLADAEDRLSKESLPISEVRLQEDRDLRDVRDQVRAVRDATSTPPETVRRARLLLRLAFDDAEEKVQAEQHLRAAGQRISEVGAAYEAACNAIGWRAPDSIAEALMGALFHRELTAAGCQSILGAIHKEAQDARVWGATRPGPPDQADPAPTKPPKAAPPRGGRRPA